MPDDRIPTAPEQALLAQGLAIFKVKSAPTNIQPTYQRWRDVWQDNLVFYAANTNDRHRFRAIAISYPMYVLDEPNVIEFTNRGYVCGTKITEAGDTQVFPIKEIVWVKPA